MMIITWLMTYKVWLLFGAAIVFFCGESLAPFRMWHESRWHHIVRNLFFILGNVIVMGVLYGAILGVGAYIRDVLHVGMMFHLSLDGWTRIIVVFLLFDLALYAWHRLNHVVPFLWRFHKVHHSDRDLDFTSSARFHFGELLLSALVKSMLLIIVGARVYEVLAFDVLITLFALFNHSNISLGRWEKFIRPIIVTPAMHRIHHSMRHQETNSNYTTILSLWDHIFGSYRFFADQRRLRIGLIAYMHPSSRSVVKMYLMPFTKK